MINYWKTKKAWSKFWEMSDITIEGDVKAQQGIRFNIFQLNQTYLGKDSRLNIGQKDLPVKSTEDPLGIRKPIVFLLYGYKTNKLLEIY
jgi:hypothetical protein